MTDQMTHEIFLAAHAAVKQTLADLDVDWTAHRPIQGEGMPKVLAYRVAAAVLARIRPPQPQAALADAPTESAPDLQRDTDAPSQLRGPAPHPQGGTEALRAAAETWRDRLLASTTFWVDDLAAHDVARQLTNLLDSEDCPHLSESGDEGPVVDLPGGWPVRWRCDGCNRIRYDDAALAELRALLAAAAPAPTASAEHDWRDIDNETVQGTLCRRCGSIAALGTRGGSCIGIWR